MNRTKRHFLFLTLVIVLLAISTSVVFAKELGLLTISGPGIKGEVTLKDPDAMMNLEKSGFFDQAFLSKPPKGLDLDKGFNMTAHLNLDGKMVPYIQMVYYPTNEGQAGYIHYTGRLEGETLQAVDEWHLLNLKADSALRNLMTTNGITVTSALVSAPAAVAPAKEPVSAPAVEPVTAPTVPARTPGLIVALVAGILALTGVALALRRRTVGQPTA
ncbi:MAG TPA: hypothetical protein VK897_20505 [Anaerolineales bacterium]|nr:hypothetical protein [Anaerolineales bacterium]